MFQKKTTQKNEEFSFQEMNHYTHNIRKIDFYNKTAFAVLMLSILAILIFHFVTILGFKDRLIVITDNTTNYRINNTIVFSEIFAKNQALLFLQFNQYTGNENFQTLWKNSIQRGKARELITSELNKGYVSNTKSANLERIFTFNEKNTIQSIRINKNTFQHIIKGVQLNISSVYIPSEINPNQTTIEKLVTERNIEIIITTKKTTINKRNQHGFKIQNIEYKAYEKENS